MTEINLSEQLQNLIFQQARQKGQLDALCELATSILKAMPIDLRSTALARFYEQTDLLASSAIAAATLESEQDLKGVDDVRDSVLEIFPK